MKRAHSFSIHVCGDPNCGPHIMAEDSHGKPICEMVLSPEAALNMVKEIQALLYEKATERKS